MKNVIWSEAIGMRPAHYEHFVAAVHGFVLTVRGPRGGSTYKWMIEEINHDGESLELAHGTCVTRDGAQYAAIARARHLCDTRRGAVRRHRPRTPPGEGGRVTELVVHESRYDRAPFTRPTELQAMRLAAAYDDGAFMAASRAADRLFSGHRSAGWNELHRSLLPSYAELRDFLIGECEVDERIASKVAMRLTRKLEVHP